MATELHIGGVVLALPDDACAQDCEDLLGALVLVEAGFAAKHATPAFWEFGRSVLSRLRSAYDSDLTTDELDALVDPEIFPVSCETCKHLWMRCQYLGVGLGDRTCDQCLEGLPNWEPKGA